MSAQASEEVPQGQEAVPATPAGLESFDGRWTGRVHSHDPFVPCANRGSVEMTISNGRVQGIVRTSSVDCVLSGNVSAEGVAQILGSCGVTDIQLQMTFSEARADGEYTDTYYGCTGSVEVVRAAE
jgi:hypothetical protein